MRIRLEKITQVSSRFALLREMYTHILLTRLVNEYAWRAYQQGQLGYVASCRGHEAVQVCSAVCIEIGQDFTLPYYRDLGVVLTIGMTPYEVFRTYFQARQKLPLPEILDSTNRPSLSSVSHWGYHKHNLVTGPAPVATQIMHAAGIAFASKLRKAQAVTVAYCGDGAAAEPDFLEGIAFAAQHQLPAIFICEQDTPPSQISTLSNQTLPEGLTYSCFDGSDALVVYNAMQEAVSHARAGLGPTLLEFRVLRTTPDGSGTCEKDPLVRCVELLKEHDAWDELWATDLQAHLRTEIEQALRDVLDGAI